MKAKCRCCKDIIETDGEEVFCGCGEISIGGNGDPMRCSATSFENFARVDDQGNEIQVSYINNPNDPSKKELINMLQSMIEDIEKLPTNAKMQSVTQFDMLTLYYWLSAFCSAGD